ncbi:MAG TPA: glycosyltransferase, partial [Nitrospira sp.]|nr:glycosyltransferase [Nitrospira sp.]
HRIGSACRFLSNLASFALIVSALYRRGRALSIAPAVIVCHDIFALAAGVRLKRVFGCALLYDSHELWPEADLIAQQWEKRLTARIEGRLVRDADVVVTVSPPLARHLERIYHIPHVISAPNAEPLAPPSIGRRVASSSKPLKCLLQGRVSPRRGIEELFEAWTEIEPDEAVLYVRCPQNAFLFELCAAFRKMIEDQRIVVLPAVPEHQLVEAAAFADIGLIPYWNSSLIHRYCCPNKLSQYMQAGLALLCNDLEYVSMVVKQYDCGLTYNAAVPESLPQAVSWLAGHLGDLDRMKRNALRASCSEFHWDAQSAEYRSALESLYWRHSGEVRQ